MPDGRLAGKVILVAGATGMAAAGAERFAVEGARVFVTSRTPADIEALVSRIGSSSGQVAARAADLQEERDVERVFTALLDRFGRLDGLFHVAGGSGRRFGDGPIHEATLEGWERTIRLNLTTQFLVLRGALRQLLAQPARRAGRGSIVLLGSITSVHPSPERFATHAYAAAKAGVNGLVAAASAYYAPVGIRVNAVAPGLVRTPMSARAQADPLVQEAAARRQPLIGAFIEPHDVVPAVVYLLSDESRAVTGQVLGVDAGWSVADGSGWAGPPASA